MTTTRMFFGLLLTLLGALSLAQYCFPGLAPGAKDWGAVLVIACLSYGLALLFARPK